MSKHPPPPLSSPPDDALGVSPGRPAVEGAVEDPDQEPFGDFVVSFGARSHVDISSKSVR